MDSINRLSSRLTKTHFVGVGVMLLVATAVCIGVAVSRHYHHYDGSSSLLSPQFRYYKDKLAQIDRTVQWKSYTSDNVSLQDAFVGGKDTNNDRIYVCRATDEKGKGIVPGEYIPGDKKCRYTYDGGVIGANEYEILTTKDASALIWSKASKGEVYNGAIVGGQTSTNEDLFICKVSFYYGSESIGRVKTDKTAYVPDGPYEYLSHNYDVLCLKELAL